MGDAERGGVDTNHVFLRFSDISEDAERTAMSQTANEPLLHVLHQLLQEHQNHKSNRY